VSLAWYDPEALAHSTARIVRRADAERLVDARAAAAALRSELEAARAAARAEGRAEGYEAGRAAWAAELAARHATRHAALHGLHGALVATVMQALRHLLAEVPEAQRLERLAGRVLETLIDARRLRLVVAPADVATARAALARWRDGRDGHVDVVADPALARGDCLVETEDGAVDGRLDARLAALEAALAARLAPMEDT
jgi:type III secretion protein L